MMQALKEFLTKERLGHFTADRNNPNKPGALSGLSPYLHYGQLGAQRMGLEASKIRKQLKVSLSQIITGSLHILTKCFSQTSWSCVLLSLMPFFSWLLSGASHPV